METNFNAAKEIALLNLYAGYIRDSGIDAHVIPVINSDSLDLLQIKLIDDRQLNL